MEIDEQLKQQLGREVCAMVDGWSLSQVMARWEVWPSRMSELRHGNLRAFSLVRLLRLAARMGYDVELTLRPRQPPARHMPPATARVVRYDRFGRVQTE